VALDAHKAKRAEVSKRVQQAQPDLDAQRIWQAVSQDAEERATWRKRQRRCRVVAQTHERTRWKRQEFAHQHSRRIVNCFDLIVLEELDVNTMVHTRNLTKSIHDVAWGQFAALIAWKAACAARRFIAVNPAYTSQECSGCGNRKTNLTLADRVYHCLGCSPSWTATGTQPSTFWQWDDTVWGLSPRSPCVYTWVVVTMGRIGAATVPPGQCRSTEAV
jgi:IS605 OrfB family transposase